MKKICSAVIVGMSLLSFTVTGFAATDYVSDLQAPSVKTRTDALKRIERGLISQPEVFKQITKNIEQELAAGIDRNRDALRLDEVAWMCKALASSGEQRYEKMLDEIMGSTSNKKVLMHCEKSKHSIERYADRRKVQKNSPKLSGFSQEMSSYINMLHSQDYLIKRDGIKNIMSSPESNEKVFDMVRDELMKELPSMSGSSPYNAVDAMSYACLCLSGSGVQKYKADLEKVMNQSRNKKLVKYATKAYNQF